MDAIFHITTRRAWALAQAEGRYIPPSLAAEGFVHCSRKDQVLRVANALFRSQDDVLVLVINPEKLGTTPVRDDCTDSGEVFPHVYGPLQTSAIEDLIELETESDGTFDWPKQEEDTSPLPPELLAVAAGYEGRNPAVAAKYH